MIEGLNEDILKRLYVTEQKSLYGITKMFGCSISNIGHRCKRYGIRIITGSRPRMEEVKGLNS